MKFEIVVPKPMTSEELWDARNKREEEKKDVFIDFSDELIEKALFLDIDGVIQQPSSQRRFDYVNDEAVMDQLYKELEDKFNVNYREFDKYDVTATYYDWNKGAVEEIRRILDVTGAKIVVSSDWRIGRMGFYLPFLLRIHDFQKYLHGYTPIYHGYGSGPKRPEYENISRTRSVEILEYIRAHPHIKKWVAVDDINMSKDIPENFVEVYPRITAEEADRCIEILGKMDS
ncbi:MAG: hypothetical protein LBC70_06200 [Chitinispirillales bacterium]|jgi:hypothetical protein|nr:hypothetical protein [Chitinispirillales bacterium]